MAASMGRTNICHFVKCVLLRSSRKQIFEHSQKHLNSATVGHNCKKVSSGCAIKTFERPQHPSLTVSAGRLNIRHNSSSINDNTTDNSDIKLDTTTEITSDEQETLINQSAVQQQDSTSDRVVETDNEEVIEAGFSEEHFETDIVELEDPVNTSDTAIEEVILDGSELFERLHQYTEEEKKLVQFEDIQDDLYLKIDLTVKSVDREVLRSYLKFLQMAALGFQIKFTTKRMPKYRITKSSILKSVHIYKKHFRQYETRTHFLFCSIHQVTGSTASVFLEYIQRNLPEGMAMKVTKYKIDMLPEHLKQKIKSVETTQNQEN